MYFPVSEQMFPFFLTAPSGPPLNFDGISTNPTILTLSWNPPEVSMRNGIIEYYSYMCQSVHAGPQTIMGLTVDVTGLTAFTEYTCSVRAATANGTGPADMITRRTAEDSKLSHCSFVFVHCTNKECLWHG